MTWKATPEQLARARAAIEAERNPKKKPSTKRKTKSKRKKPKRKKKTTPDHVTQAYLERFGPWGVE